MAPIARPTKDDWWNTLPAPQTEEVAGQDEFSEVGKGARSFGQELQALGGGAVALGAQTLQTALPKPLRPASLEEARKWGQEAYERNIAESQVPGLLPKVARIEDINLSQEGGIGRLADWAAFHGTKGLGTVATIAGTGGLTGAAAKGMLKQGIKKAAKGALRKKAEREIAIGKLGPKEAAERLARAKAGKEKAVEEVVRARTRGQIAGATGAAFGMEAGGQFGQTVSEGVSPEAALLPALGVGAVNAALELTPWGLAAKHLGLGKVAKGGIKKAIKADKGLSDKLVKIAKGAAAGMSAEAVTEGMQELVGIAGERWAKDEDIFGKLTPEQISQIKNAMAVGGLVGGGLGGAIGPMQGKMEDQAGLQTAINERIAALRQEGVEQEQAQAQAAKEAQEELARKASEPGGAESPWVVDNRGVVYPKEQAEQVQAARGQQRSREEELAQIDRETQALRETQERARLGERIQPGEGLVEGQQRVDAFRTPAERQAEVDRLAGGVTGEVFDPVTGLQRPPVAAPSQVEEGAGIAQPPARPRVFGEEITPQVPPLEQAMGETWANEAARSGMLNAIFGEEAVKQSTALQEAASMSWEEVQQIPELHDTLVAQAAGQASQIEGQTVVPTAEEVEAKTARQVRERLKEAGISLESLSPEQRAEIDASLGGIPSTLRPQAGFDQKVIEQAIQRKGRRRTKPRMIVGGPQAESVGEARTGLTPQQVREKLNKTFPKNWVKRAEAAGFLKLTEGRHPDRPNVRGRYNFDNIEIFSGALDPNTPWDAVILHEGTHAGFNEILGQAAGKFTQEIEDLGNKGDAIAKRAMEQAQAVALEKGMTQEQADAFYTEELPAYYVQYAREAGAGNGLYRRIVNGIKAWFSQTEFGQKLKTAGLGFKLTDEMAVALAKQATQLGAELRQIEQSVPGSASLESRIPVTGRNGKRVSVLDDASPRQMKAALNLARSQHEGPFFEGIRILQDPRYGIYYAWPANAELLHADVADAVGINRRTVNIVPYSKQAFDDKQVDQVLQEMPQVEVEEVVLGSEARTPRLAPTAEAVQREVFKPKLMGITDEWTFESNDDTLGRLSKLELAYVDRFAGLKKQSPDIVREMDLAQTKGSSVVADLEQDYVKPLIDKFAKRQDLKVDEVGTALAARHIIEDRVNEKQAERASEDFIKDLLPRLRKEDAKALGDARDALVKNTELTNTVRQQEMKRLMDEYVVKEQGDQDVRLDWEEFKDHAGGLSTGGAGTSNIHKVPSAHAIYDKWKDDGDFKEISRLMDELNRKALQYRLDGGLIPQGEYDRLLADKAHYMPLRREGFDYESMIAGKGSGVGKGLGTRIGSSSANHKPVHVIQNALAKAQAAAIAGQNNLARQFMAEQIQANPQHWAGWFKVNDGKSLPRMNKQGFTGKTQHSLPDMSDISFIKDGKRMLITPEASNQRATSFVRAVNNLDAKEVEGPMKLLQLGNRIIRFMNITASPAFLVANAIRDPLTAAYNLKATEADGHVKDIFKEYGNSFRALRKTILGNARDTLKPGQVPDPDAEAVARWEKAGGRISFTQSLKEMDTSAFDSFEKQAKRAQALGPKSARMFQAGKQGLEMLENTNMVMENVMRLSAFTVLTRAKSEGGAGLDDKAAAQISKDMTTNFTRKGYKSSAMGTWWLFFNATVQGNRQVIVNAMKSGKLRGMIGGTMVFSAMVDAMGRAVGAEDEDKDGKNDWDAIPHYEKERYIHFPVKLGEDWLKIPSPWVYNVVWRAGQAMGEAAAGVDGRDVASVMADLGRMSISTLNPVAGGTTMQAVAPTTLDPLVQIWENRDFAGNPLGPADLPGDTRPQSQRAWATTPPQFKWAAEALNEFSGGSKVEEGLLDIRPSTLKVLHDTFGGGLARFFQRLGGEAWDTSQGEEFEPTKWPILRQFTAKPRDTLGTQLYHERQAQVNQAVKGVERLSKSGPDQNLREAREFRRENQDILRMEKQAKDVERQIKGLRKQVRDAQGKGQDRREELLRKRIKRLQLQFNKSWKTRVGN